MVYKYEYSILDNIIKWNDDPSKYKTKSFKGKYCGETRCNQKTCCQNEYWSPGSECEGPGVLVALYNAGSIIFTQSNPFMLTVMAQVAAAIFSLIIGVATQAILPHQPWCRRRNQNFFRNSVKGAIKPNTRVFNPAVVAAARHARLQKPRGAPPAEKQLATNNAHDVNFVVWCCSRGKYLMALRVHGCPCVCQFFCDTVENLHYKAQTIHEL